MTVLRNYANQLRLFSPNARLYLANNILSGAASGIFRLLFNFYILSLGYDEALLGNLITINSFTSLLVALPMGYLADRLGRKRSLLSGGFLVTLVILSMVLFPSGWMFIAMNVLMGCAQALSGVTMGPFLMENSTEKERTYLFSFSSGLSMAAAFFGNWLGGYLPTWIALRNGFQPTDSGAYAGALIIVAFGYALATVPLAFLRTPQLNMAQRSMFAPISYLKKHIKLMGRLILPILMTSIGAGLVMPFMNVFFRNVYHQSDQAIGAMFAWGSLAMGAGLLIAPPLADRFGKIQLIVITQGLSIPFLVMLGFSPVFGLSALAYYVRLALMNMSGPVYQTYVMEKSEPGARATVASLVSMAGSFGWAFFPSVSGWIQVNYGFGPAFGGTIVLYIISVIMYFAFFWEKKTSLPVAAAVGGKAPLPAPKTDKIPKMGL